MNAPFAWPGGKHALKATLLSLLPPHDIYVEVFAGSAKLLFAKVPSRIEVINDLNGDVINFFRVAKHRPAELAERLEFEIVHAGRFKELHDLELRPATTCEIDRALRFAYLVWYSYGAKGENFGSLSIRSPRPSKSLDRVREILKRTSKRLASVMIEQRDFMSILDRYDSEKSFFYLDPPYVKFSSNGRYQPLSTETRIAMFEKLSRLQGRFILSFDDRAEIRRLAHERKFRVREVDVRYVLSHAPGSRTKKAPELLISNFALPSKLSPKTL